MTLLAIAAVLLAPPQDTISYRFSLENRQSIHVDASGIGVTGNLANLNGTIAVIIDDTIGGKSVDMRFDSLHLKISNPALAVITPQTPSAIRYRFMIADGRMTTPPVPDSMTVGSVQVMPVVAALFPTIRDGLTLGDVWTDTTTTDSTVAGRRITGVTITSWRVNDRRGDTLILMADSHGAGSASLGAQGKIGILSRGSSTVAITPGMPAISISSDLTTNIRIVMGKLSTSIKQQLKLVVKRRDLPEPPLRKQVPS